AIAAAGGPAVGAAGVGGGVGVLRTVVADLGDIVDDAVAAKLKRAILGAAVAVAVVAVVALLAGGVAAAVAAAAAEAAVGGVAGEDPAVLVGKGAVLADDEDAALALRRALGIAGRRGAVGLAAVAAHRVAVVAGLPGVYDAVAAAGGGAVG